MTEVSNSAKRQADNSGKSRNHAFDLKKKNCLSTGKQLHSTSFYLKFLLITEHKAPFRITCEIMRRLETEALKRTANALL